MAKKILFEDALANPESCFTHPDEILTVPYFTNADKLDILKEWEQDARELAVAAEEGMIGDDVSLLDEVVSAIESLESATL